MKLTSPEVVLWREFLRSKVFQGSSNLFTKIEIFNNFRASMLEVDRYDAQFYCYECCDKGYVKDIVDEVENMVRYKVERCELTEKEFLSVCPDKRDWINSRSIVALECVNKELVNEIFKRFGCKYEESNPIISIVKDRVLDNKTDTGLCPACKGKLGGMVILNYVDVYDGDKIEELRVRFSEEERIAAVPVLKSLVKSNMSRVSKLNKNCIIIHDEKKGD